MLPISVPVITLALLLAHFTLRSRRDSPNYPPGPTALPVIGNLLQLPSSRHWVKFRQWAQEYGPIFHLKAGPDHIVVLNTAEAAEDLLVKRNRIFSGRPQQHVASDIVSAGQRMAFLPGASPEYKAARKALSTVLGPVPSKEHRRVQDLESRVLLHDLLNHGSKTADLMGEEARNKDGLHDPKFFERHWFSLVRRFSTSVVMLVTYGERVHRVQGNQNLHELYEVADNLVRIAVPGAYLADVFTFLRKLPDFLAPWRVKAQIMHEREINLYGSFLTKIRSDHKTRPDSFVGKYLGARDIAIEHPTAASGRGVTHDGWLRDMLLAYSAGTIIEAGSDTTSSTIISFILFMLTHPDVMRKARSQIDQVVGQDRLPAYSDEQNLPYIVAIVKEVLRCRPAAPIGLPHRSTEPTTYKGYLIPEGSIVFGNIWAIHLDENHFENPTKFDPDRWLSSSSSPMRWGGSGPKQERDHYVFGWGRRFCMGTHIAEASLFIVVARIIWGLDVFGPASELDPWDEENYTSGFATNAVPFNVSFKPRSDDHMKIIKRSFEDSQEQWEVLGLRKDER